MNFNKEQRDILIVNLPRAVGNQDAVTQADKMVRDVIVPTVVELANDCNELEDKLNQANAVIESLKDVIRLQSKDRLDTLRGMGPG